jgi:LPXTG-site transpeptidase (sortase) family protein
MDYMARVYRDRRYSLLIRPLSVRRRWRYAGWALVLAGLVLLGATFVLTRPQGVKAPQGTVAAVSSAKPGSKTIASYTVPPDAPRYITIPAIAVPQTRVMQLGLGRGNQIAVPSNVHDAGWYDGSAKPGHSGAMFIYGHVSSWQAKGVFYNLSKLKPGDIVTVSRGDGTKLSYQVVRSKSYPHDKVDMDTVLSPVDPNVPGLNLMTCAGHVIKGTSEFDQRLIVFTRQI